jgi:hypothetical protein
MTHRSPSWLTITTVYLTIQTVQHVLASTVQLHCDHVVFVNSRGQLTALFLKGKQDAPPDDPGNHFHGQERSNETHESKSDPDALLARKGKGKEAKLSYNDNMLVENRNGLIVNAELLQANGRAERDAALLMLEQIPGDSRITVGGDRGFDTAEFVEQCRHMNVTPHVAQNDGRRGGAPSMRAPHGMPVTTSVRRRERGLRSASVA